MGTKPLCRSILDNLLDMLLSGHGHGSLRGIATPFLLSELVVPIGTVFRNLFQIQIPIAPNKLLN